MCACRKGKRGVGKKKGGEKREKRREWELVVGEMNVFERERTWDWT
jgi:hypothetical protein